MRTNLHKQAALEDFRESSGNYGLWMRKKLESRSHHRYLSPLRNLDRQVASSSF
jgi:hypothetical protein